MKRSHTVGVMSESFRSFVLRLCMNMFCIRRCHFGAHSSSLDLMVASVVEFEGIVGQN